MDWRTRGKMVMGGLAGCSHGGNNWGRRGELCKFDRFDPSPLGFIIKQVGGFGFLGFIFNWVMGWSEVMVKLCFSKQKGPVWF